LRRIVLSIFITLLSVGALFFFLVWRAHPRAVESSGQKLTPAIEIPGESTTKGFGPASRPYAKIYTDGQLSSEFNADEYLPQTDGSFKVINPI